MDREAWCAAVHGVAELDMAEWLNWTQVKKNLLIPLETAHILLVFWSFLQSIPS